MNFYLHYLVDQGYLVHDDGAIFPANVHALNVYMHSLELEGHNVKLKKKEKKKRARAPWRKAAKGVTNMFLEVLPTLVAEVSGELY